MSLHQQEPRKVFQKARQACDSCRSRKIRCDGSNPCDNCEKSGLVCIYRLPKKKGPKRRGTVDDTPQEAGEQQNVHEVSNPHSPLSDTSRFQTSPLLSVEMIQSFLDAFFIQKYPI